MTRSLVVALALGAGLTGAGAAAAAEPAQIAAGDRAFQYSCAPCHGSGPGERARFLPGTEALAAKYKGERPALLEQRDDLTPAFVGFIIRHGIEGMPFFRKTEISDETMAAIGAYLSRPKK